MSGIRRPSRLLVLEKAEEAGMGTVSVNSVLTQKVRNAQDNMGWGHFKPDLFISVFIVFLGACAQAHVGPQRIEPCTAFVEVSLLSQGTGWLITGGKLWTSLK